MGADTAFSDPSPPNTVYQSATEDRYSATTPFDNVNDYNTFSMTGIKDITGTDVTGLENYTATVTVSQAGTALGLALDEQALKIVVVVSHPNGTQITLEGYRTRYAPSTLP